MFSAVWHLCHRWHVLPLGVRRSADVWCGYSAHYFCRVSCATSSQISEQISSQIHLFPLAIDQSFPVPNPTFVMRRIFCLLCLLLCLYPVSCYVLVCVVSMRVIYILYVECVLSMLFLFRNCKAHWVDNRGMHYINCSIVIINSSGTGFHLQSSGKRKSCLVWNDGKIQSSNVRGVVWQVGADSCYGNWALLAVFLNIWRHYRQSVLIDSWERHARVWRCRSL